MRKYDFLKLENDTKSSKIGLFEPSLTQYELFGHIDHFLRPLAAQDDVFEG